ncbi:polysaccharide pyruvyl transferase family protein [Paracoccus sp. ME4]|uniref:polysaccharide pyruvyl transferase family protein n=1 Tax=Paracoccus sp. ME4 TaxID=3138066 RepID=UPI00398AA583
MRILFHGPGSTFVRPATRLPSLGGVQYGLVDTLAGIKPSHDLTGNRGNLIHGEAPSRILACDPARSANTNIAALQKMLGERYATLVGENFDLLVLSLANMIRPRLDMTRLLNALKPLVGRIPIVVLGMGKQGRAPLADLHPSARDLLSLFNDNALVMGVRGLETRDWLHQNGFGNAVALGCPSLYCYPQSILEIDATELRAKGQQAEVLTAGYVTTRDGHNQARGAALVRALKGLSASYVFQDEFFAYGDLANRPFGYNEATCMADAASLNAMLSAENGLPVSFRRYYYFNDSAAWRQAAHAHDVYVGDRFHGGVASLHAGRPTVMLAHDNRVEELADFFGVPRMTTGEFARKGLAGTVAEDLSDERLARMKNTYRTRHAEFVAALTRHQIGVVTRLP